MARDARGLQIAAGNFAQSREASRGATQLFADGAVDVH